jgi:catechol 2,3-dioxygenase-like lactoylglutathione lyase family enzyme
MRRISFSLVLAFLGFVVGLSAQTVQAQTSADKPSMEIGFMGVGINVADVARAEKFYTEVFGLVRTFQFPPEGTPMEVGLARPGGGITLLLAHLSDDPLPQGKSAYGRIVINTDDARALADRAIAHGSKLLRDLGSPGGPVILFMSDPDGYEFELYQAPSGQ